MSEERTFARRRRLGFGVALGVSLGALTWASGCASLLGLEKKPLEDGGNGGAGGDGPGDGLVLDEESGRRTTPQCIEYCDTVMGNCTGDFAQYFERGTCIDTCNALPPGEAAEPIGNTVACRLTFARTSEGINAAENCPAAGAASDGCGGKCEAWCSILETACPANFAEFRATSCEDACEHFPSRPGQFDLRADQVGNSVECHVYHATVALESSGAASTHCPHTRFWAQSNCSPRSGPVSCEVYCQNVFAACSGERAVYDDKADCLAACATLEPGLSPGSGSVDSTQNTVACRTYHANAALLDSRTHCPHASPSGDGTCGAYPLSEQQVSGNCDSYCTLYAAGCPDAFAFDFPIAEDCSNQCLKAFRSVGGASASGYAIEAIEDDTLQCRIYRAVKALSAQEQGEEVLRIAQCEQASMTGCFEEACERPPGARCTAPE